MKKSIAVNASDDKEIEVFFARNMSLIIKECYTCILRNLELRLKLLSLIDLVS